MIKLKIINLKEYQEKIKKQIFIIHYSFYESTFGKSLIGIHDDSVCHLSFVDIADSVNLNALKKQWPRSSLILNEKLIRSIGKKIFGSDNDIIKVILKGTPFEAKVWRELLNIPKGSTISYENVAVNIGQEKAVRAVANAVAKNSVAYLVPCHRVIKKNGEIHKYRWGTKVKTGILNFEKKFS